VLGALGAASLAAGVALTIPAPVHAASSSGRLPKDLLPGGALDRFVVQQAAQDKFSGTVLLAHHGRPVLIRSCGMADRQQSVPNRMDTIFSLASITKIITGLAVAQLAQQGKVVFHEKLGAYLDGFPAEIANRVTVHQLLTHTSGVGRPPLGPGIPGSQEWDTAGEVVNGTMAVIRQAPPQFPPGTRYSYTNDGFWILGAIIAQVSGQSYFDYVREHIFAPAGMTRTDFYTRPQVPANPDIARPYWTQQSGTRVDFTTTPYFEFIGGPDGGAYSTAEDLLRFVTALRTGRLLNRSFAELVTGGKVPVPPTGRPTGASQRLAGYGFEDLIFGDRRVFGHPGGGPGRATNLDVYPDLGWVSVVLGNYDTTIDPIVDLQRQLIGSQG
jgi:CubicO group peptidase (beta-lactamase class C family)